uniref:Flagellar basal-body rod protein FlgC n=1 Tax=Glossina pallidipes TaxID=7398 RepID=A0A1A9Z112_GLOPL
MLNILKISGSALFAQSCRINVSASNIANSESIDKNGTPYQSKQVIFQLDNSNYNNQIGGVKIKKIINDKKPLKLVYDPNHPFSDENGYVKMPNVNIVEEMVNTISASRSYQANIEVINTARSMILKTLSLGQ